MATNAIQAQGQGSNLSVDLCYIDEMLEQNRIITESKLGFLITAEDKQIFETSKVTNAAAGGGQQKPDWYGIGVISILSARDDDKSGFLLPVLCFDFAYKCFRRACMKEGQKDCRPYTKLGLMNIFEIGTKKNIQYGVKLLVQASSLGGKLASYYLASSKRFTFKSKLSSDGQLRKEYLERAKGFAPADCLCALQTERDTTDLRKACLLYKAAAQKGNLVAIFRIGLMYVKGVQSSDGKVLVQQSPEKGIGLIKAAAEHGCARALEFIFSDSIRSMHGFFEKQLF